jgi:hypothetical protein
MVPSDGLRKDDSLLLQGDRPHMITLLVDNLVQHSPDEAAMIDYDGQCFDRSALRRRLKTLFSTSCVPRKCRPDQPRPRPDLARNDPSTD